LVMYVVVGVWGWERGVCVGWGAAVGEENSWGEMMGLGFVCGVCGGGSFVSV